MASPAQSLVLAALIVALLAPLHVASQAPGSAAVVTTADYERAMGLRAKYANLPIDIVDEPTWLAGAPQFHYRKAVAGGHEFVLVDATTGVKRPAFDHERLARSLSQATGGGYTARTLPFTSVAFENGTQALRVNAGGSAWLCTFSDYDCRTAGAAAGRGGPRGAGGGGAGGRGAGAGAGAGNGQSAAETPAVVSPDGRWEAFVRDHNLGARERGGAGRAIMLSLEGGAGDAYDASSIRWSPDSRHIAVYRVRPGTDRLANYIISSPSYQLQPDFMQIDYAKPGDLVDQRTPVLFDVAAARQTVVSNALFPNPYSLSQLEWREDGRAVVFAYNQRGHQVYRIIEVDPGGRARAVVSEELEDGIAYRGAGANQRESGAFFRRDVNDGREIIWMSERDGWKHLYLYDGLTGRVKNRITQGDWVVRYVVRVDEADRRIWFMGSGMDAGKDPYYLHFFRVNFDGSDFTRLTTAEGNHSVEMSPDGRYFVDTYSRVDLAPVMELRGSSDGALIAALERGDIGPLLAAGWKPPEVFSAKGRDGTTDIWGLVIRPSTYDPARRYPVIENIYAGPQGHFVSKSWEPFRPHSSGDGIIGMQSLAELGFIVVMIDGMGTAGRSRAFHRVAWKNLKDAGFPDRIAWHRAVAARDPAYDTTRVGIYGGSAGGQNALGALLFHPDFYDVAVTYNGCHDNRMDKISWNELWMSWPIGPQYAESSNVDNAWRLQGKVLLVAGELDTNVDPASTLQVANALIQADKTFDMLFIPNGPHGVGRTGELADYGSRARYDYFVRHLHRAEPPAWNRVE